MHYENNELGFSFNLPDDWRGDEGNLTLTFFGPNGRIGCTSEVIQLKIGAILSQYHSPESREIFLAEPGAQVSRRKIGDEANVVVLKRKSNCEISAVRDGVHYNFTYSNDATTLKAIDLLCESAQFPNAEQARAANQNWSNPRRQAMNKALRADSPEQVRQILSEAGMPPSIQRPGYSIHRVTDQEPSDRARVKQNKKWWEFWK